MPDAEGIRLAMAQHTGQAAVPDTTAPKAAAKIRS
jgi:hypothetical protein